ncbi:EscC/YscC/HrcC family type III secretion system outer membrane ring protein [Dyella sp. M7H15-1]|uniref:EscC/YscC/HrcC family type III secretion system outer membrane ring protein n=1 Tax=Dyella sp. M7H15-1 TaxID=2501295 RepID=UPI001004D6FA|nr:EscC/YscC/HrcC family type III secretion system outer membrane ring protein [Dyella sp. M7H15-1]QAU24835.1 EscC/YscC/HrcC family type III secretion system outer membrane ring protein [Dyella sp. M7H15-1]
MRLPALLIASIFLFACQSVWGKPIPWRGEPFFVSSRGNPLAAVLKDLGANYGLPVVVSPQITEHYAGTLQDTPPGYALRELSRLYQLLPYYDGNTLYVYKAQEVSQTLITPSYIDTPQLERLILQSKLLDDKACHLLPVGSANAIQVTGVPICLTRVGELAKQLDVQNLNQEQNKETIALYPLKYASAADTNYAYRNQNVVVPGVVSVLRDMAQGHALPLPDDKTADPKDTSGLPSFSADTLQNAVLIRDRKKNMPLYSELISKLDKRPALIEISVAIIDVDAADIQALGVNWSGSTRIGGGQVSFNSGGGLDSDSFSSVVSNSSGFMARINALAEQSKATIVSRPSVVTLDNVQAILDRNITFYTKLSSKENTQLASVAAGSLMRVTPRLIHDEGTQDKVLLTLNIQDGRQAPAIGGSEQLPQIQNAEIATQATLNVGQALLLGGFVQNEHVQGKSKIPLLGDLPLIGGLFRSKSQSTRSVVRIFLIDARPRLLD